MAGGGRLYIYTGHEILFFLFFPHHYLNNLDGHRRKKIASAFCLRLTLTHQRDGWLREVTATEGNRREGCEKWDILAHLDQTEGHLDLASTAGLSVKYLMTVIELQQTQIPVDRPLLHVNMRRNPPPPKTPRCNLNTHKSKY